LCLSNHWCHFFEEREKQYAESKRKGVVGSTGKKIPRMAKPRETNPETRKKTRFPKRFLSTIFF
jgi:hypothetical protein